MKYIKQYEDIKNEPEYGDYIVVNMKNNPAAIARSLERNIGKIINTYSDTTIIGKNTYKASFGNISVWVDRRDIIDCSKNKEDLEHYIIANKFNI